MREPATQPAIITRTDVDRAQRGEEALRRLDAAVHELAGLIDGSLRLLDMARRRLAPASAPESTDVHEALRHVEGAHAALSHIAHLVHETYDPGAGRTRLRSENTPGMASAILSAADLLRPAAEERHIRLEVEIDEALAQIPADQIYSIVSNALRNAIDAVGHGGEITVRAATASGRIMIEVADNGPGPPAGAGARVFDPGFTTKPGSSGIGLSLAREIVTELHGSIELLPRPTGRGAVLRVNLPVPGTGPC